MSSMLLVELFWRLQVFTLLTNGIVARYFDQEKLRLSRDLTNDKFNALFARADSLKGSTIRTNLHGKVKLKLMWKLRQAFRKPAMRHSIEKLMMSILCGEQEAVHAFNRCPWNLRTNGEFRFFFHLD